MKKLGKLNIDPEKVMKNEELVSIGGGGYGSYRCFRQIAAGQCVDFADYINTASCTMANVVCAEVYGGICVDGGDCT